MKSVIVESQGEQTRWDCKNKNNLMAWLKASYGADYTILTDAQAKRKNMIRFQNLLLAT